VGLDLTQDIEPPLQTYIEVQVLKDCGEILNDNEERVILAPNSVHYLPRKLVEPFILQGAIEVKK
jgi:hypothetical protein